ncbi:quinone-dependent dihydroorotate dehydrogenase [Rhodocytophaga aerolata]|uniref:Dihydroorotate dehydrogenase (quinone) n=1 Tax=Rhodocytophaga aerolata TaxID=455078 RepID=A0ABT8R4S4_9BACT|nr:quinone-dependent dihydroorotate dehydrogenase [Rhodocytophaga aerolata]MDO1447089.1 quinone-dependent dihydroorotate dehydrogenase [Rhodocytophaga aerolata]
MYKALLQPLLFNLEAEKAHEFVFNSVKQTFKLSPIASVFKRQYTFEHPALEREVFGLKFKNPVGLAAGFDKNAELTDELACMGFGFIEIGTLTPRPQEGNPKPRMFRLKEDKALINRMGFNNQGVEVAAHRLKNRKSDIIIGGNIGKNKNTPNEQALSDYLFCFDALYDVVDYFVVNVSSPNTPNLRDLQEKEPLTQLLQSLQNRNQSKPKLKPILLKIAPDLTDGQLDDIIDIVKQTRIAGVVATNTTISREGLHTDKATIQAIGAGGLSGQPLKKRSTEVIRYLTEKSGKAFPVIGVGGIASAADALEKLKAGASLVQYYTGFIYQGPELAKKINQAIIQQKEYI